MLWKGYAGTMVELTWHDTNATLLADWCMEETLVSHYIVTDQ